MEPSIIAILYLRKPRHFSPIGASPDLVAAETAVKLRRPKVGCLFKFSAPDEPLSFPLASIQPLDSLGHVSVFSRRAASNPPDAGQYEPSEWMVRHPTLSRAAGSYVAGTRTDEEFDMGSFAGFGLFCGIGD